MITRIVIHNMYSIKDVDINFDKGRYQFLNEYVLNNKISNPIAIYGRNGSGKSSFIKAIGDLVFLLTKNQTEPFPFIRNLYNKNDPNSSIVIEFIIDKDSYFYELSTNYECITEEHLMINGIDVLERNEKQFTYNGVSKKVESKLYPAIRTLITYNSINKDIISRAYYYLANIAIIKGNYREGLVNSLKGVDFLDNAVDKSDGVKKIIKTYNSFPVYDIKSRIKDDGQKEYFAHIETDGENNVELPINYISDGMLDQSMMLSTLLTLPENGVLIVDELETALHPLTIKNFINEVIKRNIQLIFTSHNTNILSYLRPDNIVFANWKNGKSSYKRLHEIYENIREVNNIEKMYLSSTFDEDIEK